MACTKQTAHRGTGGKLKPVTFGDEPDEKMAMVMMEKGRENLGNQNQIPSLGQA